MGQPQARVIGLPCAPGPRHAVTQRQLVDDQGQQQPWSSVTAGAAGGACRCRQSSAPSVASPSSEQPLAAAAPGRRCSEPPASTVQPVAAPWQALSNVASTNRLRLASSSFFLAQWASAAPRLVELGLRRAPAPAAPRHCASRGIASVRKSICRLVSVASSAVGRPGWCGTRAAKAPLDQLQRRQGLRVPGSRWAMNRMLKSVVGAAMYFSWIFAASSPQARLDGLWPASAAAASVTVPASSRRS